MSYDSSTWTPERFKWYVRDAELMLKQLKIWIEDPEKAKKLKEEGGLADTNISAEYILKHSKFLFKSLTGREY